MSQSERKKICVKWANLTEEILSGLKLVNLLIELAEKAEKEILDGLQNGNNRIISVTTKSGNRYNVLIPYPEEDYQPSLKLVPLE